MSFVPIIKQDHIRSVLLHDWDPIGIVDIVEAHNEYETYIPTITSVIEQGATIETLTHALLSIERNEMGLVGDEYRARTVAKKLLRLT